MDVPIQFGVEESLLKGALRGGTNITQAAISDLKGEEVDPGLPPTEQDMGGPQMGQPQQGMPAPGMGGGMQQGIELGAYSKEGIPLYR